MDIHTLFQAFENGTLHLPQASAAFAEIPWSPHPAFPGVDLKHLMTAEASGGQCSFHLVRIAPGRGIGRHVHEGRVETHEVIQGGGYCRVQGTTLTYAPGVITVFPADVPHEIQAGDAGLRLFAKFFPALG